MTDTLLPLFYKNIRALDKTRDLDLRIRQEQDCNFAVGTNAIPLVIDEFAYASADYPIVFTPGEMPVPVAVVGIRLDHNAMVTNGTWREGMYVPAYVRRYPFILVEDPDTKQMILCVEDEAPQLTTGKGFALFKQDAPSDFTTKTLEFCMALRQQGETTEAFIRELKHRDLLKTSSINVSMPRSGRAVSMDGFLAIDRQRFMATPSAIIAEWHRKEWLGLIYAHMHSATRWQRLAELCDT